MWMQFSILSPLPNDSPWNCFVFRINLWHLNISKLCIWKLNAVWFFAKNCVNLPWILRYSVVYFTYFLSLGKTSPHELFRRKSYWMNTQWKITGRESENTWFSECKPFFFFFLFIWSKNRRWKNFRKIQLLKIGFWIFFFWNVYFKRPERWWKKNKY